MNRKSPEPLTRTLYCKGQGEITEPIVKKPAGWSRKQWRVAVKKAHRAQRDAAITEARKPEAIKIDERLHAAGLFSPRDARAVRPVRFDTHLIGA